MDLLTASTMPFPTPRAAFGESRLLEGSEQVYAASDGLYLWVGNHLGPNELVHTVGWAKSDFWAVFLWGPLATSHDNPHSKTEGTPAPSLASLGLPDPLEFSVTLEALRETRHERTWPPLQSVSYRWTDGRVVSHHLTDGRITLHYERANPRKRDLPVAIGIELQGLGQPKEVLIAQSERGRRLGIFGRRK